MLKSQVSIKDATGKIIKSVYSDYETVALIYTDGSFSILVATQQYDEPAEVVDFEGDEEAYGFLKMERQGIMSKEEIHVLRMKVEEDREAQRRKIELAQLARLQAKYKGEDK